MRAIMASPLELTLDEKIEVASDYIKDAFLEAEHTGIEKDVIAHTAIYNALNHLITLYGEETVSAFSQDLPQRIMSGEFSGNRTHH